LALATDLAQKGWKLAIVDMNTTQGEAVVAKLGEGNAIFIKADVSKWEENVRFFKETKEKFGRIDFGIACSSVEKLTCSGCECGNRRYSGPVYPLGRHHKTEFQDYRSGFIWTLVRYVHCPSLFPHQ
jgi:NAD(P)-dependent dehydrogenase (short-subunit alcohol dehydrogenase family)